VQTRNIIFAAVAVLVLGALLMLVMKVKEEPAKVPEDKLAQARASHSRSGATRAPSQPAPADDLDSKASKRAKRAKSVANSKSEDDDEGRSEKPKIPSIRMAAGGTTPTISVKPRDTGVGGKMDEANSLYDKNDWEGAQEKAIEILSESPKNTRMMRIVVSTACKMGQEDVASEWFPKLPAKDQKVMATRCARYEIELE
jgi:predicted Zn-dependent protease